MFYEEFEDVCALANSCKGLSYREMLVALRGRCRGSHLQMYRNVYKAAWQAGKVLNDAQSVYDKIKSRHLAFAESREEREIRVDAERSSRAQGAPPKKVLTRIAVRMAMKSRSAVRLRRRERQIGMVLSSAGAPSTARRAAGWDSDLVLVRTS